MNLEHPALAMTRDASCKYSAFISYSHADEKWARWLHRGLERFRIPRHLIGRDTANGPVPDTLYPVFRDRDELAAADQLGSAIEAALEASRWLIVICSPHAANSRWVNEEVRYFRKVGGGERILCLIVDGEPDGGAQECFPAAVRFASGEPGGRDEIEPLAADARQGGDGRRPARLKLIAGVLGVDYEELRRRDLQVRHRRQRALTVGAASIAAAMAFLALSALKARDAAEAQRQLADSRRAQAEDMIGFMLGDLRDRLETIGRLDLLDAVGDQAMHYFAQVPAAELSDTELSARALALRQIGESRVNRGELELAAKVFREALALDEEILRRHPADLEALFNAAQSEFYVGYDHYVRGEYAVARPWFERYQRSSRRLFASDPENVRWAIELASAEINLGALDAEIGSSRLAAEAFERALVTFQPFIDSPSPDPARIELVSDAMSWLGKMQRELGDVQASLGTAHRHLAMNEALFRNNPDNWLLRRDFVRSGLHVLRSMLELPVSEEFWTLAQRFRSQIDALLERDSENEEWQLAAADLDYFVARAALQSEKPDEGVVGLRSALEHSLQRARSESGIAWKRRAAGVATTLVGHFRAIGEPQTAARFASEIFAVWPAGESAADRRNPIRAKLCTEVLALPDTVRFETECDRNPTQRTDATGDSP